jgi:hypothetical protein
LFCRPPFQQITSDKRTNASWFRCCLTLPCAIWLCGTVLFELRRFPAVLVPMPITFTVNEHAARVVQITSKSTAQAFAAEICKKVDARRRHPDQTHLLASSLNTRSLPQIIPTKNGFVETCIAAYNQHHHLIIRPDDVWLTIITQFSFFANGHPEELKDRITPVHRRKPLSIAVNGDSWMSNSKWLSQAFVDSMKASRFHSQFTPIVLTGA